MLIIVARGAMSETSMKNYFSNTMSPEFYNMYVKHSTLQILNSSTMIKLQGTLQVCWVIAALELVRNLYSSAFCKCNNMYYGPAFFFFIFVMEHSGNHPKKAQKGFSIETTSYSKTLKTGENLAKKKPD